MILPAEHPPVHGVAEVRLRTLAGFARGCTYRQLAEDSLGTPLTVQEVGSYHAILACVAAGACVGVLPRSVLQLLGTPPLRSLPCRSRHLAGLARRLRDRRLRTLARRAGPGRRLSGQGRTQRPGSGPTPSHQNNSEPRSCP